MYRKNVVKQIVKVNYQGWMSVSTFWSRGGGTGTASTAVTVPLLWRMRLSRTKIGAILMTSLRLALALTPASQDDKRGEKLSKTRAVPSTLALSQGI